MRKRCESAVSERLSGQDLAFWWTDSPMQPTTMAMLLLLDRQPDRRRLRHAFERAVSHVPRLTQRVVEAPLGLTLPRWEPDPTFDLEYHVRRHSLSGHADLARLLREIAPTYETPFDRSRPLWEVRVFDGLHGNAKAALFFKLHHAVADGVGGNAIFAALTDREPEAPIPSDSLDRRAFHGAWPDRLPLAWRLLDALRDRVALDTERAGELVDAASDTLRHPEKLIRAVAAMGSILQLARSNRRLSQRRFGRTRGLSVLDLPFEAIRKIKRALGGSMIDVILTIMACSMRRWHMQRHLDHKMHDLMTLVPVNLRKPEEWAETSSVGNIASGILLPLPIRYADPLTAYRAIHTGIEAQKADPTSAASPLLAELLSVLPRRLVAWMTEATFGTVDLIVTNVPGILATRYLAGAEILAAYPFAPVAAKSPVSVALYGYRDRLFIGLNSDQAVMPDVDAFNAMICESFQELRRAVHQRNRARRLATRP